MICYRAYVAIKSKVAHKMYLSSGHLFNGYVIFKIVKRRVFSMAFNVTMIYVQVGTLPPMRVETYIPPELG